MKPGALPTSAAAPLLTREQVASWLQVRPRQVERLGVPCLTFGRKTVRYHPGDVQRWIDAQRARRT